jgi:hypothetical protein
MSDAVRIRAKEGVSNGENTGRLIDLTTSLLMRMHLSILKGIR